MTQESTTAPTWGKGVRTLRKEWQLTQAELAELAGTKQPVISRLEGGNRRIPDELRVSIAKALNTDPHFLFPYEDAS